eukprot:GHVH01002314.1.p1 GENE.GHVH01002314.1~~GHVH01002314.1.p1  ORF type:complete len:1039 (+),score=114.21 GHVH01002314.1:329-3445(+)
MSFQRSPFGAKPQYRGNVGFPTSGSNLPTSISCSNLHNHASPLRPHSSVPPRSSPGDSENSLRSSPFASVPSRTPNPNHHHSTSTQSGAWALNGHQSEKGSLGSASYLNHSQSVTTLHPNTQTTHSISRHNSVMPSDTRVFVSPPEEPVRPTLRSRTPSNNMSGSVESPGHAGLMSSPLQPDGSSQYPSMHRVDIDRRANIRATPATRDEQRRSRSHFPRKNSMMHDDLLKKSPFAGDLLSSISPTRQPEFTHHYQRDSSGRPTDDITLPVTLSPLKSELTVENRNPVAARTYRRSSGSRYSERSNNPTLINSCQKLSVGGSVQSTRILPNTVMVENSSRILSPLLPASPPLVQPVPLPNTNFKEGPEKFKQRTSSIDLGSRYDLFKDRFEVPIPQQREYGRDVYTDLYYHSRSNPWHGTAEVRQANNADVKQRIANVPNKPEVSVSSGSITPNARNIPDYTSELGYVDTRPLGDDELRPYQGSRSLVLTPQDSIANYNVELSHRDNFRSSDFKNVDGVSGEGGGIAIGTRSFDSNIRDTWPLNTRSYDSRSHDIPESVDSRNFDKGPDAWTQQAESLHSDNRPLDTAVSFEGQFYKGGDHKSGDTWVSSILSQSSNTLIAPTVAALNSHESIPPSDSSHEVIITHSISDTASDKAGLKNFPEVGDTTTEVDPATGRTTKRTVLSRKVLTNNNEKVIKSINAAKDCKLEAIEIDASDSSKTLVVATTASSGGANGVKLNRICRPLVQVHPKWEVYPSIFPKIVPANYDHLDHLGGWMFLDDDTPTQNGDPKFHDPNLTVDIDESMNGFDNAIKELVSIIKNPNFKRELHYSKPSQPGGVSFERPSEADINCRFVLPTQDLLMEPLVQSYIEIDSNAEKNTRNYSLPICRAVECLQESPRKVSFAVAEESKSESNSESHQLSSSRMPEGIVAGCNLTPVINSRGSQSLVVVTPTRSKSDFRRETSRFSVGPSELSASDSRYAESDFESSSTIALDQSGLWMTTEGDLKGPLKSEAIRTNPLAEGLGRPCEGGSTDSRSG